jgi:hypothetical protein
MQPVAEFNDDYSDLFTLIDAANLSGTSYQPPSRRFAMSGSG